MKGKMMKLYHGTSAKDGRVDSILQNGISPRIENGNSNWEHTVPSRSDCVYLTEGYAGYFAHQAAKNDNDWVIVEVDIDKLNRSLLRPDEDFIAYYYHINGPDWMQKMELIDLTEFIRDDIDKYADCWNDSIIGLGNCSYKGIIPPEAITRISIYDSSSNFEMTVMALDPCITPLNHQLCGDRYRMLTRWLMGEDISLEEYKEVTHMFYGYPGAPTDEDLKNMLMTRKCKVILGNLAPI